MATKNKSVEQPGATPVDEVKTTSEKATESSSSSSSSAETPSTPPPSTLKDSAANVSRDVVRTPESAPASTAASTDTPAVARGAIPISNGGNTELSAGEEELFQLRNRLAHAEERASTAEGKLVDLVKSGVAIPGSPPPVAPADVAALTTPILIENKTTAPMWLGLDGYILPGEEQVRGIGGAVLNQGVTAEQYATRTAEQWAVLEANSHVRVRGLPASEQQKFDAALKAEQNRLLRADIQKKAEDAVLDRQLMSR